MTPRIELGDGVEERMRGAVQQVLDRVWVQFTLTQVRQNIATFTTEELAQLVAMVAAEQQRRGQ